MRLLPLLPLPLALASTFDFALLPRQTSNLQSFAGALSNIPAPPITNSGIPDRPFAVAQDTFPDFAAAAQRSCDVQFQGCQGAANAGGNGNGNGNGGGKGSEKGKGKGKDKGEDLTVALCESQKDQCLKAQQTATVQDFAPVGTVNIGPDPLFPDFDLICEA